MLYEGRLIKNSLTDKQKNPKSKKGVKSIQLKTDDSIKQVKVEKKGEIVEKKKSVKKKVDKHKRAVKKKKQGKPDAKERIEMRLRGTGKNIRDLRTDIINDMTESRNKNVLNDYEFLKADKKFKPVKRTQNADQIINTAETYDLWDAAKPVLARHGKNVKFRNYEWLRKQFTEGAFTEYKDELASLIQKNKERWENGEPPIADELSKLLRKNTIKKIGEIINKHLYKEGKALKIKNITKEQIYLQLLRPIFHPYIEAIKSDLRK